MKKSVFIENRTFENQQECELKKFRYIEADLAISSDPKKVKSRNKQNKMFKSHFPVLNQKYVDKPQFQSEIKIQDFQIGQFLGKGSYGTVRTARHTKTGYFCSIKTLKRNKVQQQLNKFIRGLKIQMFLNHPNIVKIYGIIVQKKEVHILMELCIDGNLCENLKEISTNEKKSLELLRGVTNGVRYMHNMGIMHRDLKLQNIILNYGMPKLCDFDLALPSVSYDSSTRKTICGSPAYFSPEMILTCEYSMKADIWSLGIIFYEILCGYFPFNLTDVKDVKQIMQKTMRQPRKEMNELAKNLLYGMLEKKQKNRFDIQKVAHHPYLSLLSTKPKE